jgi:hypothetical protein
MAAQIRATRKSGMAQTLSLIDLEISRERTENGPFSRRSPIRDAISKEGVVEEMSRS